MTDEQSPFNPPRQSFSSNSVNTIQVSIMDHGKEHHHGSHHAATQHGKKEHAAEPKHQSHTEETHQTPRTGLQLGQTGTGYGNNKATELSSFANTKEFEDLEAESHSNSGHEHEERADRDDDKHEDFHGKK